MNAKKRVNEDFFGFYVEGQCDELLDNDELGPAEEAFIRGYLEL